MIFHEDSITYEIITLLKDKFNRQPEESSISMQKIYQHIEIPLNESSMPIYYLEEQIETTKSTVEAAIQKLKELELIVQEENKLSFTSNVRNWLEIERKINDFHNPNLILCSECFSKYSDDVICEECNENFLKYEDQKLIQDISRHNNR